MPGSSLLLLLLSTLPSNYLVYSLRHPSSLPSNYLIKGSARCIIIIIIVIIIAIIIIVVGVVVVSYFFLGWFALSREINSSKSQQ